MLTSNTLFAKLLIQQLKYNSGLTLRRSERLPSGAHLEYRRIQTNTDKFRAKIQNNTEYLCRNTDKHRTFPVLLNVLRLAYCKPVRLAYCKPVRLAYCKPVRLAYCKPVRLAYCKPVRLAYCKPVRLAYCKPVRLAYCKPVRLAYCKPVRLAYCKPVRLA